MVYEKLVKRILRKYKCQRCGRCCSIPPMVALEDIDRISKHLGISKNVFIDVYTVIRTEGKPYLMNPCPFYVSKTKSCQIYSVRPKVCRFFPFQIDAPIIFGMNWCPTAKAITTDLMKHFPASPDVEPPDFIKVRQKLADFVAPETNAEFLQQRSKCLVVPLKEIRWLLRR